MSDPSVHEQPTQEPRLERGHHPPPNRRFADEDRAWSQLYSAVLEGQASTAEEVIKALDADPKAKQLRLALYTHAKTTLRKQKAAEARKQRLALFLRSVLTFVVFGPVRLVRSVLSNSADVAVEMLPPARKEPAAARAPALKRDPAFAESKAKFGPEPEGVPSSVPAEEGSRTTKAA